VEAVVRVLANGGDEAAVPRDAVCVSDGARGGEEAALAVLALVPGEDAVVAAFAATAGDMQRASSGSEIAVARDARMRICRG